MTSPNGKKRVLAPAVFDAIKSQAEKHGGIGSGRMFEFPSREPLCGVGCAYAGGALTLPEQELAAVRETFHNYTPEEVLAEALARATGKDSRLGFSWLDSDRAVSDARIELGLGWNDRVPFEDWARELNIVRGVELPWAVYDALKASAEKYGGIGYATVGEPGAPCCILGHAHQQDNSWVAASLADGAVVRALKKAFGMPWRNVGRINDDAVSAISARKDTSVFQTRVTFEEWADELNVVRGAE